MKIIRKKIHSLTLHPAGFSGSANLQNQQVFHTISVKYSQFCQQWAWQQLVCSTNDYFQRRI